MLLSYIITVVILSILVLFCDYSINKNTMVSAIIKTIIFIIFSIGLIILMLYLRGEFNPPSPNRDTNDDDDNNNNNNNNNNKDINEAINEDINEDFFDDFPDY